MRFAVFARCEQLTVAPELSIVPPVDVPPVSWLPAGVSVSLEQPGADTTDPVKRSAVKYADALARCLMKASQVQRVGNHR